MKLRSVLSGAVMLLTAVSLSAQEPAEHVEKKLGPADIIMPHITDAKHVELPCFKSLSEWSCEFDLPVWNVHVAGKTIDLGLTKHVVFLFLAAAATLILLLGVAASHKRHSHDVGRPKGFAAGMEAIILYLRNEIYLPVLGGHGGERYVPFCLTLFFFILWCNLFGLMPWLIAHKKNVNGLS